ncbi:MAG: HEPN domain-containing protein [Desulfomonile tiedjei]|uniref:HEPN domain-containing protein n=1 Tax=Desulfomonile tiedjei TaxID=2358 RepID=A0A9D6V5L3_9BACT|nr:HEPN domain-containing protein [Desulfomonile tiedjei]
MIDREDAERMLTLAKVDLKAIRNMPDPEAFEDSVFGFHAQQAVEKALKAWLTLRGIPYPKTHDLRLLLNLLEGTAQEDCQRFESLVDLTDFAVQFRYDFPTPAHGLDRCSIISEAQSVIGHVERLLQLMDTLE